MSRTIGILLAGGLSRRFGSPKAFACYEGQPFFEIAIKALEAHCDEVIIVTRPELLARFPATSHAIVDLEKYSGLGPLAGILSAMEIRKADRYVVLPCDMPRIHQIIIGRLLASHQTEVTAVMSEGRFHPLVSVWENGLQDQLTNALEDRRLSVMKFLSVMKVEWIEGSSLTDDENNVFVNVNTPESLERG